MLVLAFYVEKDCPTEAVAVSKETVMAARAYAQFHEAPDLQDPDTGKSKRHGSLPNLTCHI